MTTKKTETNNELPAPFQKALPKSFRVEKDRLVLRLDFHSESIVMQTFDKKNGAGAFKLVSAYDLSRAMAANLSFDSGLLPEGALWWQNSKSGPLVALWVPAGIRRLALQLDSVNPVRYDVPLPGLIFLCHPGRAPHVFAALKRPTGLQEKVFKAPLANVYDDGRTCPGNNKFPDNIAEIPDNFFRSFFSRGANLNNRSKKYPQDITQLWKHLDGKKEFPESDLIHHGFVSDLMRSTF
jgi:PRTRC genetic system protein B